MEVPDGCRRTADPRLEPPETALRRDTWTGRTAADVTGLRAETDSYPVAWRYTFLLHIGTLLDMVGSADYVPRRTISSPATANIARRIVPHAAHFDRFSK